MLASLVVYIGALLVRAIFSVILALVEALLFVWILPYAGLTYDPTYWQAFAFCVLANLVIGFASMDRKV
jgi:hypothetical protein